LWNKERKREREEIFSYFFFQEIALAVGFFFGIAA
jgi:hypothetical protein